MLMSKLEVGFGLWKDYGIDGLEYQLKIRSEWDRDCDLNSDSGSPNPAA